MVILVTDGWIANTGDAASYIATTNSLQSAIPGARVAIATHHRGLVGHLYPELDLVPPLDSIAGVEWPWTSPIDQAESAVVERLVEEADIVLAAGGGYLLERYQPEGRIRVYEELLGRGKRLMFYAQSIGRFQDPELGGRLQAVLEAAELILVRDEPSLEIVTAQRGAENVHLTADEAFLFPPTRQLSQPRSLLATISAHPWDRRQGASELDEDGYAAQIGASLGRLLAAGEVRRITLASTGQGLGHAGLGIEDDSLIAAAVREAIPANWRNRVHLVSEYLRPDEYARLAGQHTATLSMRMHGVILATTAGSPVLLANASDKASALSARTGGGIKAIADRDDLGCLDELIAPILAAPADALVGQNEAVEQMRALARKNAELVARTMR